jgi:hypothetical protein
MTLEEIIRDALLGYSPFTAIVGAAGLYLVQLPQNVLGTLQNDTCVATYQRVAGTRIYAHASACDVGAARFQFTAWAGGKSGGARVLAAAQAIIAGLRTFNASQLPTSPEVLLGAPNFVLDQRMEVEPQTRPPIFKCTLDARIWFRDQ